MALSAAIVRLGHELGGTIMEVNEYEQALAAYKKAGKVKK